LKSTILIVEDIADNAVLLAEALRNGGYNDIHVVTDPTKVIDSCLELRPDLMLLDLRMPKVDGFEILTRLREVEDPPLVLVLTADVSVEARNKALGMGAKDFLSKPYGQEELMLRAANLLETRALHAGLRAANRDLETTIKERTRDLWSAVQEVGATSAELRRSREQTVIRLALAAELKDDETSNHVTRVSRYCETLAAAAGYDKESAGLLRLASVMHDVGKIGVPGKIVLARGKLTAEERLIMQSHTVIGHRILDGSQTPLLDLAASIALTHHERYDGSGYPNGLAGVAIPLEGRISAIADVFDALTTDRVYRRRFDLATALRMMSDGRSRDFDPGLVDLFLGSMDQILAIKEMHEDAA